MVALRELAERAVEDEFCASVRRLVAVMNAEWPSRDGASVQRFLVGLSKAHQVHLAAMAVISEGKWQ